MTDLDDLLHDLRPETITDETYRQTAPKRAAFDLLTEALTSGRWHRLGEMWPAYTADSELGALLEQAHHTIWEDGDPPILTPRRVTHLAFKDLEVLDLSTENALKQLGLTLAQVRSHDQEHAYPLCQRLADAAWKSHPATGALKVPSAVAHGLTVLVIHPRAFRHFTVISEEKRRLEPHDVP